MRRISGFDLSHAEAAATQSADRLVPDDPLRVAEPRRPRPRHLVLGRARQLPGGRTLRRRAPGGSDLAAIPRVHGARRAAPGDGSPYGPAAGPSRSRCLVTTHASARRGRTGWFARDHASSVDRIPRTPSRPPGRRPTVPASGVADHHVTVPTDVSDRQLRPRYPRASYRPRDGGLPAQSRVVAHTAAQGGVAYAREIYFFFQAACRTSLRDAMAAGHTTVHTHAVTQSLQHGATT